MASNRMNKNKITFYNVISSFLLQFITLLNGFILPKIILSCFGSDVNGLVSSLTKFLSYISILEGGVTGVVMASMYKPLQQKDNIKLNSVLKTTQNFYKKIGLFFALYSVALSIVYPVAFKSNFSFGYVSSLCLIMAIGTFIQYNFSITLRTLLNADKKVYIVALTQSIIIITNIIISLIVVRIYPNVHILKFASGILFIIQPLVFNYYVNKKYSINLEKSSEDKKLLKSRWDGFAINIAGFIHTNTDILILTIFTDLATVSVYSVYALVTSGLRTVVTAVSNGIAPAIGQLYAEEKIEKLNEKIDIYEYLVFIMVGLLFGVSSLLITPFVLLYTQGINDANYNQLIFGVVLLIGEAIYLLKLPHLDLAYSANKFKEMSKHAYIEALINIVISIALVKKFSLLGIAMGTLVAMIYRTIYQVMFTKKMINRSPIKFFKNIIIFTVVSLIDVAICYLLVSHVKISIISWVSHGFIYFLVFSASYFIMSLISYKRELKFLLNYIRR